MEEAELDENPSKTESLEVWLSEHAILVLFVVLGLAFLISVLILGAYALNFQGSPVSGSSGKWGEFGDFLGGTLNPVFGFLSVIAILTALVVQSRELKISSAELRNSAKALQAQNLAIEHQSFEQTFFAWLNNYHELLQSITGENLLNEKRSSGRAALYSWWGPAMTGGLPYEYIKYKLNHPDKYKDWYRTLVGNEVQKFDAAMQAISDHKEFSGFVLDAWNKTYLYHEYQLDSLFRNLYRLLLWIHSNDQLTQAQKWLYVSIVRGQLSWIEQAFLFYNGLTVRGAKFRRLINAYALFDNLTFENDPILLHLRLNPPPDLAYEERAFNSVLAREAIQLPVTAEGVISLAASTIPSLNIRTNPPHVNIKLRKRGRAS